MQQKRQQRETEEAPIRSYLDALTKPMDLLGEEARQEWRSEAASHLQSLIAAHKELGATHEEALVAAFEQFSRVPEKTGRQVQHAARNAMADQSGWQVAARILCYAFAPTYIGFAALGAAALLYAASDSPSAFALLRGTALIGTVVIPVLNGWRAGVTISRWRTAKQANRSQSTVRQRPRHDCFPRPLWMREYCPDADFLPWLALMTSLQMVVGAMFSYFLHADLPMPSFSCILSNGAIWLSLTVAFTVAFTIASSCWSTRRVVTEH